MNRNFNNLRDLVLSMAQDPWFIEHRENIMFELNHCELHKLDTYFFNLYNAGIKQLPNENSSNILYLLGMTDVEPTHRINTVGGSFPDIDSDFERDKREMVFEYLKEKYGDGFAHLGTVTYLAGKNAWKSAARIHGLPFAKANDISKMMPDLNCPELGQLLKENKAIAKLYNSDPEIREVYDDAIAMQDVVSSVGIHACLSGDSAITCYDTKENAFFYKNLKDMEVGDYVLTPYKNIKKVLAVHHRVIPNITGNELVKVDFFEGAKLKTLICTPNHKFIIKNSNLYKSRYRFGKREIGDLFLPGNKIRLASSSLEVNEHLAWDRFLNESKIPIEKVYEELVSDWIGFFIKNKEKIPEFFKNFTEEDFEALKAEYNTLMSDTGDILTFKYYGKIKTPQKGKLFKVVADTIAFKKEWAKILSETFLRLLNKNMPPVKYWIMAEAFHFISSFNSDICSDEAVISWYVHSEPSYDVYDLTVEDDASYIANGIYVSNCGVAISDRPLWEEIPLWDSKGVTVTQGEASKIEDDFGIVKLVIWRF